MNEGSIRKVIHRRFSRLKRSYNRMKKKMDMDDIHRFRVEIKKLRAFLRMLSSDRSQKIKLPAPLKNIYRKAGVLRNTQLIHSLHNNQDNSNEINAAADKLEKPMHHQPIRRSRVKIEKELPLKCSVPAIQGFYKKKISAIRTILSARVIPDSQLHTVRKHLKDILYNATTFEKDLHRPYPVDPWNAAIEEYITRITDQLGKFVDEGNELRHLQHTDDHTRAEEEKLIASLQNQREQIRKDIMPLLEAVGS